MGRRFKGYYFRPSADADVSKNIAESLAALSQPSEFPFGKVANSFCYMAYRCLDGEYRHVDQVLSLFPAVFELVDSQPYDHIRARWLVAIVTANTYLTGVMRGVDAIDVSFLDRALDIHLLMPPDGWQRSLVNSLSCHMIRAHIAKRAGDIDVLHEVLFSALEVYRRTIPTYQFIDDSSDILYEVHDAAAILGGLIEMGRGTQFPVRYLQHAGFSLASLPNGPLRDLMLVHQ
jgi:hypothetical protein